MLDGWFIVKCKLVVVPVAGALPVPVQPVHTCCEIMDSGAGELTENVMSAPALNHPVNGEGEP